MNLREMLHRASSEAGSKVFTISETGKKTFGQFAAEAGAFAAGLSSLGIKKGDRVAILLNNSPEFLTSYFGCVCIGVEVVPLNTFLSLEEITYILTDCSAKVLVTSPDFDAVLKDFSINRVNSLEKVISTGPSTVKGALLYSSFLSDEKPPEPVIIDTDTAVIIYTSGTTGHPKGAMLSHSNLVSNVEASIKAIHISNNDRFIIFLPMFHAFSFTVCVLIPIYCMCRLSIVKSIQPFGKIIKAIMRDRVNIFVAIPPVYNVLSAKKFNKLLLGIFMNIFPIRVCVSGAAPLSAEVLKNFEDKFKVPLIEGYGLSETSPVVSVNPLDGIRKPGSVGLPIPGVEVAIVDEEGKILGTNETGEITVKGPNVMKGYFNREKETAEIIKNNRLFTGDIGRIDEEGYIYIMDRKKDMILVNGMNLYPREVEEVLYRHPAVAECAVVGKKDAQRGETPVGVIVLKEGVTAAEKEIKSFCKQHLALFKVPGRIEFWDSMPKTGTGKILKREVRRIINEAREKKVD